MKFADNIIREPLDEVIVARPFDEMAAREEFESNLWEEIRFTGKKNHDGKPLRFFKVPARDIKIGETIFTPKGDFLTYRSA